MKIEVTSRWAGVVLALGVALTLTGTYALAANRVTSAPTAIYACAKKATGSLRLTTQARGCAGDETSISWNEAGPAGPAGAPGAAGRAGAPGISGLEIVQLGSGFAHQPAVTVSCPSGKRAIGGGYDTELAGHPGVQMPQAWVNQNLPNATGRQWVLQGSNPQLLWKIQGYVICAVVQG